MADGTSKTGSMKRLASQRSRTAFLLCLPLMLLVAGFVVYPAFYALYLSMLNKKMTAFVGLGNFAQLANDDRFLESLGRTFWFTVLGLASNLPLGLGIALLMHERFPGRGVCR